MNKICVYAICKNELKFVDNWIKNMSVADYICVLDTGSTDGTYEKLCKYQSMAPDKIIVKQQEIKPWRFDVARNESIKLCPEDANILISTDLDELFNNQNWAELIKANWKPNITRCFYNYAWSHNEVGEPRDIFKYDKCHTRDYHWIFPVHEVLAPIADEFTQVAIDLSNYIMLEHFQDKNKERKYYFDLLKVACDENPNNSHTRMLLAREYVIKGDNKNALKEFLEVLKMPDVNEPNRRLVLLNSLLQVAFIYEQEKNFDEAIWYCQEFIKEDYTYRDPYFLMAEMYNLMHIYSLAEACVEAGRTYGVRKYNWVERGPTWLGWGNDLLGVACYNLGNYKKACRHMKKALNHDPDNLRLLKNYANCLEKVLENKEKENNKKEN